MTIDQRIKYLISLTCDGNQRAFAKKIGAKPQAISNLLSRKSAPGFKLIQQILREFSLLNPHWFILGEGEIGEEFLAKYEGDRGYTVVLQEPKAGYEKVPEQIQALNQRIATLEREVNLLEQIVKDKEVIIGHLKGK